MRTAYVVLVSAWAAAAFCATAAADNHAPVVSNVTASQRTDGSKLLDIRYDLADADVDAPLGSQGEHSEIPAKGVLAGAGPSGGKSRLGRHQAAASPIGQL